MSFFNRNKYAIYHIIILTSLVAQLVKNLPAVQETRVQSLSQEGPGFPRREYWSELPFPPPDHCVTMTYYFQ